MWPSAWPGISSTANASPAISTVSPSSTRRVGSAGRHRRVALVTRRAGGVLGGHAVVQQVRLERAGDHAGAPDVVRQLLVGAALHHLVGPDQPHELRAAAEVVGVVVRDDDAPHARVAELPSAPRQRRSVPGVPRPASMMRPAVVVRDRVAVDVVERPRQRQGDAVDAAAEVGHDRAASARHGRRCVTRTGRGASELGARDLRGRVGLEHVALLDVVVVLEQDAALEARCTSRTSSLKCLSEAISPSHTTVPSRTTRICELRRDGRRCVTMQPAIVPMRRDLEHRPHLGLADDVLDGVRARAGRRAASRRPR